MTFSSKFSSNCSHILEVILSQTFVQTLSIVLEKIMATVVTKIRNFMDIPRSNTNTEKCHANAAVSKNCNIHPICSIRKFAFLQRVRKQSLLL
jgi:hypothetical protein